MANTITNQDDIIDSREIIERIEELEGERQALFDAVEEARAAYKYHDSDDTKSTPEWSDLVEARKALADWEGDEELTILKALADEAEPESSDWIHGESLIRRSHFVDYIAEIIHDCYEMPKQMQSGEWPWRHVQINYEDAAQEAEQDYAVVYFDGIEYLIRSC